LEKSKNDDLKKESYLDKDEEDLMEYFNIKMSKANRHRADKKGILNNVKEAEWK
jgi:hypothetical protein